MYHPRWRYPSEQLHEQGYKTSLWASEWYKLFEDDANDDRGKLTWRDYFSKVREGGKTLVFFSPTDEAFRPFNTPLPAAGSEPGAYEQPNFDDVPGLEDVLQNFGWCQDNARLGTYSWSFQELMKGRVEADAASIFGGWGFNDPYVTGEYYNFTVSEANLIPESQLKTRPLFAKNLNYLKLYSNSAVKLSEYEIEELLANDFPALTFAAGHMGITGAPIPNVNIPQTYINGSWPREENEWRHSDIFSVAYPYLYRFYDSLSNVIKTGKP